MEDNEAQLAEQLLNSGWNKLVKTVKDFVIVDKSEEATVSTYVDGQNQCMSKAQDSDNNHISDLSDELLEFTDDVCDHVQIPTLVRKSFIVGRFDPFFHEGHDIAQDIMKHLTSWNGHGLKYSPDSKETSDNIKLA
ncbi:hypothetical protein GLOIN_2v1485700 [Rhizophagus irregularis DAOM 181602=DAOM 197198]|uniref:Uncharacterized protein n=1 Tax=Rhizophagus irregularis (strain DAOM 181602 / DAOM 197198 / MUCL 43194) TaxID=747089 RepID=A0A2P4P9R3_RHIID|nr:hypothetical protein GLOIN_2v1485700 [Rhizophagus irregularis DAOM 181602=DAOM 197198]POG62125.1 hypothetical protein GLOIN_2v1485700 [Rhizophagus irregularis DAOM 181602=DAOM 197198]|eukprot:XP_025168991.1 hypothetical protein GLOIN_2v1485700 [Rhizophagus irregularis DAOM 181602=DAOM 197198]